MPELLLQLREALAHLHRHGREPIIDWMSRDPRGDRGQIVATLIEVFAPTM